MKAALWVPLVLAAALVLDARGQPPLKDASVDELVTRLAPAPGASRSARNLVPEARPPGVDLVVHFEFDSARLQRASVPLLEKLAAAMQDPRLKEARFRVEGHTDARGGAAYNQSLSLRRAQSVAGFLESKGVSRARLEPVGKGFAEPLDKADPTAPENRRVRISPQP